MADRGHNGHGYRKIWHALLVKPDYIVCWLCGGVIDQSLKYPHSMSKSLDMVVPYNDGGDPTDPNNYRPAHYGHNSGRRDRSPEAYRKILQDKMRGVEPRRNPGKPRKRHWVTDDQP